MRSTALNGLLLAAVVGLSAPAAATAACPRGGKTLARNDQARVWRVTPKSTVDDPQDNRSYGCAYRTGRIFRLDPRNGELSDFSEGSTVKLRGTTVAYEQGQNGPYRVVVRNLRSGKVLHSATANSGGDADGHIGPVDRLLLKSNGSVAWTASVDCVCEGIDYAENGWEVHAIGRDNRRVVLETGPAVDPLSLGFRQSGTVISWKHGGETRTAPLR